MSLLKANAVQLGQSVTATNNFTWYQPSSPDGTVRLGNGNSGSVTDLVTLTSAGNLGIGTSSPGYKLDVRGVVSSNDTIRVGDGTTTNIMSIAGGSGNGVIGTSSNHSLELRTNNTAKATLDSSGNLGLGVTPSANCGGRSLNVGNAGSGLFAAVSLGGSGGDYGGVGYNLGWQTTTGQYKYLQTDTSSWIQFASGGFKFFTAPSGTAGNAISFTQAMTLDASGKLLVGTTSLSNSGIISGYTNSATPAGRFVGGSGLVDGGIALMVDKYSTTNTSSQWFLGFTINNQATASGVITANGASQAAFGTWSDRRLKTNIVDLPPQLSNILALRPVEFDYIESEGGGHQISFIAQEMEEVYPDAVGERPDGMKTITGWSKTEARLVKAIQELSAELNELKQKVNA